MKATVFRSFLFLIIAPGVVAGYIPLALLRRGPQIEMGLLIWLAIPLWLIGAVIVLWSFWNFLVQGCGTPAPIDPPKELVVVGFYRYMRNPMYVGVLLLIIGYFLWFGYWWLLIYTMIVFVVFHSFIVLYEEPTLKKNFGVVHETYCEQASRWIPKLK